MRHVQRLMPIAAALVLISALLPSSAMGARATGFVPVEELEPGDRCVGRTVFEGSRIDTFGLMILGVVRGVSPASDLIIARAEGGILEKTGILQGMSGSPVYLGDRLVGAVSGTWPFATEPVAGITPIREMLPALDAIDAARFERSGGGGSIRGSDLMPPGERLTSGLSWLSPASGVDRSGAPDARTGCLGTFRGRGLLPLDLPLAFSDGDPGFLTRLSAVLRPAGLVPVVGSVRSGTAEGGLIEPGSCVGIELVGGDMSVAAIGTVTHRDGDRILAFGHPLFNSGSIEIPMIGAYVHALMPLQSASFKYASRTEVIGAALVDRRRAVAGRIGDPPPTVPLRVRVRSEGTPEPVSYAFDVVRSRPFLAFFAGVAAADAISEGARSVGAASVEMRAVVSTPADDIEYENMFFTESPTFRTAAELGTLLDVICDNSIEKILPTAIDLDVTIREGVLWTEIARVEADRSVYRPGDTVRVTITLKDRQGTEGSRVVDLPLPDSLPDGDLLLRVGGAASFHEWEADRLGDGLRPRSLSQLLDLIDRSKPGNAIVAQILSARPGLSLSGSEMREIPGKAALVLATSATSGTVDPTNETVVAEKEVIVSSEVRGDHEVDLTVRSER